MPVHHQECGLLTGTRSAEGIMASGHANRANRPNTWLHRPATRREVLTCQPGAVHTWHLRDVDVDAQYVRFRGEADIPDFARQCPLMTQSGLSPFVSVITLPPIFTESGAAAQTSRDGIVRRSPQSCRQSSQTDVVQSRQEFSERKFRSSILMGDHVGKDSTYDIGPAVDDHDVLTPHEVRKVRIGDLVDKVVRRRK